MKKSVIAIAALVIGGAVFWISIGEDWRRFVATAPTDGDVLFWTQDQREAGFRMMDRVPVIMKARDMTASAEPRVLAKGAPLDLGLETNYMVDQNHAALVILHKGQIRHEDYGLEFNDSGRWTSFSVAKSITSTLVGAAIKDGHIESLDADVTDYIEGLKGSAYEGVTIAQLLSMTSGVAWDETYTDPNSDVARFVEHESSDDRPAIVSYMAGLDRAHTPGTVWNYSTGETNLIGVLVSEATGKTLADYLEEKLWGAYMEQDASWLISPDGHEVSGCCIQAATRDFARFGQFLLDGAVVGGESIVPEGWIEAATTTRAETPFEGEGYGYQWWTYDDGTYAARGIFGQGIFIDPARELVVAMNSNWTTALGTDDDERATREVLYRRIQAAVDREAAAS